MWVIAESITAGLIISLINKYLISKDIFECCRTVNINEDNNDISLNINFDEVLKTFKIQNPIEQNNSCNDLLNEINYKLLYIINEKLNYYQDRIPKDDIQAFKIINEMVYKAEIENISTSDIILNDDYVKVQNEINSIGNDKFDMHEKEINNISNEFKKSVIDINKIWNIKENLKC